MVSLVGSSIYYVCTFLDFFWLSHPLWGIIQQLRGHNHALLLHWFWKRQPPKNNVGKIRWELVGMWSIFDHLISSPWTGFVLKVDKNGPHTHKYPPHLAHVVFWRLPFSESMQYWTKLLISGSEWPKTKHNFWCIPGILGTYTIPK